MSAGENESSPHHVKIASITYEEESRYTVWASRYSDFPKGHWYGPVAKIRIRNDGNVVRSVILMGDTIVSNGEAYSGPLNVDSNHFRYENQGAGRSDIILPSHYVDIRIPLHHGNNEVHECTLKSLIVDGHLYQIEPIHLNPPRSCRYESIPGCFVTTAAYGDPENKMVREFRGLRDEVLVNYMAGRAFIRWYNRNGPWLAAKIRHRPILRAGSRMVLTPVATAIGVSRGTRCSLSKGLVATAKDSKPGG